MSEKYVPPEYDRHGMRRLLADPDVRLYLETSDYWDAYLKLVFRVTNKWVSPEYRARSQALLEQMVVEGVKERLLR